MLDRLKSSLDELVDRELSSHSPGPINPDDDPIKGLLDALVIATPEESDSDLARAAARDYLSGDFEAVERRLHGRAESPDEWNVLGAALAHLIHQRNDPALYHLVAEAFRASAETAAIEEVPARERIAEAGDDPGSRNALESARVMDVEGRETERPEAGGADEVSRLPRHQRALDNADIVGKALGLLSR